jgi:hypothetical protein
MELDRTRTETLEQSPSWYFSDIFFVTFLLSRSSAFCDDEQVERAIIYVRRADASIKRHEKRHGRLCESY